MAEYYPLLAKAVGSLPNSTPDTRRVVYERARKALIGQLRMLHPPVPDEDIERESSELDRAVERLEGELAAGRSPPPPAASSGSPAAPPASGTPATGPPTLPRSPRPAITKTDAARAGAEQAAMPSVPARSESPRPAATPRPASMLPEAGGARLAAPPGRPSSIRGPDGIPAAAAGEGAAASIPPEASAKAPPANPTARARLDGQRPIAPQPPAGDGSRRRAWILPVGIGVIVIAVAVAAYKLRDTRSVVARAKPVEQTGGDSGKIAERIGEPLGATKSGQRRASQDSGVASQPSAGAPSNPEVPVAQRAALLIEAPDEPNKVKTFLGTVVWKINKVGTGATPSDGPTVEADIDLPDDKMKAVVTFEKNTDASLPASHTIKVRFAMQPDSASGDVQQISVPQLRQEDTPSGEALAGVTVPVVQNSFLVGLSPGNAETVNLKQLKDMQWIDVPMLLTSGKIAKLTFEKGPAGERDLDEAITAWQKS